MRHTKYVSPRNDTKGKINGIYIIKGMLLAYIVSLVAFLIIGGLIHFTKISEDIVPVSVNIVSALSVLIGGLYVAKNVDTRGWLNGGIMGLLYVLILLILSLFLVPDASLGISSFVKLALGFVIGALGGILGVNI